MDTPTLHICSCFKQLMRLLFPTFGKPTNGKSTIKRHCVGNYNSPLFYAFLMFRARSELDLSVFTLTLRPILASSFLAQVMRGQKMIHSNTPRALKSQLPTVPSWGKNELGRNYIRNCVYSVCVVRWATC